MRTRQWERHSRKRLRSIFLMVKLERKKNMDRGWIMKIQKMSWTRKRSKTI